MSDDSRGGGVMMPILVGEHDPGASNPSNVRSGSISSSWPTETDIRSGRWIDLTHEPASEGASALCQSITTAILPRLGTRPIGPAGMPRAIRETGTIIAGILRAAFRGDVVSAQRRFGGGVWTSSPIGNRAFWAKTDALATVGLVEMREGVRTNLFDGEAPVFRGLPTRLWPSAKLFELAHQHGVSVATISSDWRVSRDAEQATVEIEDDALVILRDLTNREVITIPPARAAEADEMRRRLVELNATVRAGDVRGCFAPAFRRVFIGSLRLHGRIYALGGSNFQNQPREDRAHITIGGEPTAEVDLHAAQLTILLGLTGSTTLPADDLYSALELPREAVKAWVVRSFGEGKLVNRWGAETSPEVRAVRPTAIRDVAVQAYPALRDLTAIVPSDLLATLPVEWHAWAAGQYLVNTESRVMDAALLELRRQGIVGLPMHDAIIVPKGAVQAASEALQGAMQEIVGIVPVVHCE
jgi:hypothetical protein